MIGRTILFIFIICIVALGVWLLMQPILNARAARPKKLTNPEKIELNEARDLIASLHRSASEVSNEQPFGYIVMDEINAHNKRVRALG